MKPLQFIAPVLHGKIPKETSLSIGGALTIFEGKRVVISVAESKRKRSNSQNAFWWGVCIPIIRSWFADHGYNFDAEEVHDWLVRRVWKFTEVVVMPDGEAFERRLSSTKLSTMEWESKIDLVRQWGAEHGLNIPFPHERFNEEPTAA